MQDEIALNLLCRMIDQCTQDREVSTMQKVVTKSCARRGQIEISY
jgi:hypothetical protein